MARPRTRMEPMAGTSIQLTETFMDYARARSKDFKLSLGEYLEKYCNDKPDLVNISQLEAELSKVSSKLTEFRAESQAEISAMRARTLKLKTELAEFEALLQTKISSSLAKNSEFDTEIARLSVGLHAAKEQYEKSLEKVLSDLVDRKPVDDLRILSSGLLMLRVESAWVPYSEFSNAVSSLISRELFRNATALLQSLLKAERREMTLDQLHYFDKKTDKSLPLLERIRIIDVNYKTGYYNELCALTPAEISTEQTCPVVDQKTLNKLKEAALLDYNQWLDQHSPVDSQGNTVVLPSAVLPSEKLEQWALCDLMKGMSANTLYDRVRDFLDDCKKTRWAAFNNEQDQINLEWGILLLGLPEFGGHTPESALAQVEAQR